MLQLRLLQLGGRLKPKIVISGVNLVDLGPLTIFREAMSTLAQACSDRYEIIALVKRQAAFEIPGITYMEFPNVKGSWISRLLFEYLHSLQLSRSLQPVLWIAMHDITPRVECDRQFVYCHNPSPFYRFSLWESYLDPKFGMFTLFYTFLYAIFLRRNSAVIVQQDWIRKEFIGHYSVKNVIVAHPAVTLAKVPEPLPAAPGKLYTFIYPAFPRTFKNHELVLSAVKLLEERNVRGFRVLLTIGASSNRCAAGLIRRYGSLQSVQWLGSLPQAKVYELYRESSCLLFPSKLETWGLPLTEFKALGKPILAANLPYAHETLGSYGLVEFFDIDNPAALADMMEKAIAGTLKWLSVSAEPIQQPFAKDWPALWALVLPAISGEGLNAAPNSATGQAI